MNKVLRDQIMNLPPIERAELAQEIWDSLPNDFVLTDEQRAELDRRIAEHEANPTSALPWEQVRAELWSRYK